MFTVSELLQENQQGRGYKLPLVHSTSWKYSILWKFSLHFVHIFRTDWKFLTKLEALIQSIFINIFYALKIFKSNLQMFLENCKSPMNCVRLKKKKSDKRSVNMGFTRYKVFVDLISYTKQDFGKKIKLKPSQR